MVEPVAVAAHAVELTPILWNDTAIVVGSGPGGLQTSYYLSRLGIDHAVISADPAPGVR